MDMGEETSEYAISYVDDLVVFWKKYRKLVQHLNIVRVRFTTACFTVNGNKCKFFQWKISFLGHKSAFRHNHSEWLQFSTTRRLGTKGVYAKF